MKTFLKSIFALLLLLQISQLGKAQSNTTAKIQGQLLGENQEVVMYASIALMKLDATVVAGEISSETGEFGIAIAASGTYQLRIEHIEYETFITEPFQVSAGATKFLPTITLAPSINALNEVVVTHKKAAIEVQADKLVFNVADSPSASGMDALEVLKRAPGVTEDMENNISLMGKGGIRIYINGVPSRLSGSDLATFLQSMPSDNIQAIEIITNPSAKYEAEGDAGIINIRMKKNPATGFNGSATSSFTQGRFTRLSNSLLLNYGGEKIRANVELSQSKNKEFDRFLDTKMQNTAILDLDSEEISDRKTYNLAFGVEAQLSENQTLNLSGRSVLNRNENVIDGRTDIFGTDPKELSLILLSQSILDLPSTNHNLNLDHRWAISPNASWRTALSFGHYQSDRNTQQPNTFLEADGTTINAIEDSEFDADNRINLWSAKTDFEQSWEQISLSTGAKYSYIATRNDFDFYNINNQNKVFDASKSNLFNYTEKVAALYGIVNLRWSDALQVEAGLRIEHTASQGQLISTAEVDNKDVLRNYTDFFPNLGLTFQPQENHTWAFSISRRINRPNYQSLNPFETPISQLTIWKGNPFLNPNYSMNYQASYTYQQKLLITNTYSITNGFFANIFEIIGENSNQIIPRNMEKMTRYAVAVSYPWSITKKWDLTTYADAARLTYDGDLEGTLIDINATTWSLRFQNNIKLPWDMVFDLTYYISSDWVWRGSINVEGNQNVGFGLRKDFLDKRLQVRLTGSDIFRTTNDYFYNGNYGGIAIDGVRSFDTQRFGMGVTFKFGNQQAKTRRKSKSALEEELNRIEE